MKKIILSALQLSKLFSDWTYVFFSISQFGVSDQTSNCRQAAGTLTLSQKDERLIGLEPLSGCSSTRHWLQGLTKWSRPGFTGNEHDLLLAWPLLWPGQEITGAIRDLASLSGRRQTDPSTLSLDSYFQKGEMVSLRTRMCRLIQAEADGAAILPIVPHFEHLKGDSIP